jgi:hypothetical protein
MGFTAAEWGKLPSGFPQNTQTLPCPPGKTEGLGEEDKDTTEAPETSVLGDTCQGSSQPLCWVLTCCRGISIPVCPWGEALASPSQSQKREWKRAGDRGAHGPAEERAVVPFCVCGR